MTVRTVGAGRSAPRVGVTGGGGLVLLVGAAVLSLEEFTGTFGDAQQVSCGSVRDLPWTPDLNAYSCRGALGHRVILVSGLIAVALALLVLAAIHGSSLRRSRHLWAWRISAVGLAVLTGLATLWVGHHLMWQVSGA